MRKMALLWLLSVVAVALVTSTLTLAQVRGRRPVAPRVMSGEDFGFRVEALTGDRPTGVLVVRVDGEWVEVDLGAGSRALQSSDLE